MSDERKAKEEAVNQHIEVAKEKLAELRQAWSNLREACEANGWPLTYYMDDEGESALDELEDVIKGMEYEMSEQFSRDLDECGKEGK